MPPPHESENPIIINTTLGDIRLDPRTYDAIQLVATERGTDFAEALNHLLDQGIALDGLAHKTLNSGGDLMISMPAHGSEPAFDVRFSHHDVLDHTRFGLFLERVRGVFS